MAHESGAGQMPRNSYNPDDRGLGARVDRSQERYEPSPLEARRVVPDVQVPGDHTLTSKIIVYGGAALAAAAVTAGSVLAVRKVADLVTGNDEIDRDADRAADVARDRVYGRSRGRAAAPRFAGLSDRERDAMRSRARASFADLDDERARLRRAAADQDAQRHPDPDRPRRPPPPRRPAAPPRNFLGDIEHGAESLTRNLTGVVTAVGAAVAAFRAVADQAGDVMRQFNGTADQLRGFFNNPQGGMGQPQPRPRQAATDDELFKRTPRRDVVDLRDETGAVPPDAPDTPAVETADVADPRTHRL